MARFSVAPDSHSNANVNLALRKSNPNATTFPMVAIGLGRTYASAARNPVAFDRSAGVLESCDEIDGVDRIFFRLLGATGDVFVERLCEKLGELLSTEMVEVFVDFGLPCVEIEVGESGRTVSSREKTERSSPFQRSPHW